MPDFITGQRRQASPDDKIGPGYYNPSKADKIVMDNSPSQKFKPEKRVKE